MDIINDIISKGISLMSEQKYEAAKKEFELAIENDPKSYDAYIHLGNACANLGEFGEAITAFKNALIINENSGEALFSIANIYLLKDEKLKAVEFYNKSEKAGYKRAELYQILASIFFDVDDIPQALRNITRAIDVEPLNGELRLFKTRIYLAVNKYDEALETLDEMNKILPDAYETYNLRSQIYCSQGKYREALEICEQGCLRFPDDPNISLIKLKALVDMQKDLDASKLIATMKSNGQYDAVLKEAAIQESIIHLRKNDVSTTLGLLDAANNALDGDSDLIYLMMDVYGKTENYEKTMEMAEKLIAMGSNEHYEYTARYFRAHSMDKLGKTEEAKVEYKNLTSLLRKATINNPAFYEGYIYRLLCHTHLGEFDKAFELADYLENLHPERSDAHTFRYFIYKEQGDLEKAEKSREKAIKLNPNVNL